MSSILVVGDSFCNWRNELTDWPVALSTKLSKSLLGFGLPGQPWWWIRDKFLQYYHSEEYESVDLVVFCHTDPYRIITPFLKGPGNTPDLSPDAVQFYLTYLDNRDFMNWACKRWFEELNDLLWGKKRVIHLQCFSDTDKWFDTLKGIKVTTPLCDVSLSEPGVTWDKFMRDQRRNHFSEHNNIKLADLLYNIVLSAPKRWPDLSMSWTQTS